MNTRRPDVTGDSIDANLINTAISGGAPVELFNASHREALQALGELHLMQEYYVKECKRLTVPDYPIRSPDAVLKQLININNPRYRLYLVDLWRKTYEEVLASRTNEEQIAA